MIGGKTMPKLMIHLAKQVYASYGINPDTDDVALAVRIEGENLKSYDYEEMLNLNWNFKELPPDIIEVDLISPDNEA
jgi:aspartyl aminopeptidase